MSRLGSLRGLRSTFATAVREALANRRGLWTQIGIMFANDCMWVAFWLLFFREVGAVRGWDADRVVLLLAVLTTSGGVVLGVFHNVRNIGQLVADGGLDAALALPVHPLPHLVVRKVQPIGLGDLVFGLALFAVAGDPSPGRTLVFVVGVVASSILLGSFLVLMGSLAFFAGRNEASELGFHSILVFSSYPVDVFSGVFKVLLYSAVPAGFVAAVPARLIDGFDARLALGYAAVVVGFAGLALTTFTFGLRRYTSGSTWSRA